MFDQGWVLSGTVYEEGNLSINMSEITIMCFEGKNEAKMKALSSKERTNSM